ncbi:Cytosol aminopeptidase [Kingella potus]|uniref:Probable cytosol aminopeptidase n=1 Tax=Kingella potus TaxID=265175 RepID=A0A377R4P9_9NEIS|nr:leucyl aminopeptidase [Kingella potus]STR02952.1 Cytosol aminopeptidase [Kingella potus]
MEFITKAAALQPHPEGAVLYLAAAGTQPPADEAAALLLASLDEGDTFAAAQTVSGGTLRPVAVCRPAGFERESLEKAAAEAAAWAQKQQSLAIVLPASDENAAALAAEVFVIALGAAVYRFDRFKKEAKPARLQRAAFYTGYEAAVQTALTDAEATLYGINLCKDLGNTAPNVCTPQYLADTARAEAEKFGAAATILDKDYIRERMGAFWSVAKGSVQNPFLIELRWNGASDPDEAPVVLVGKGITFDSGGISLKPGEAMDEMKYDMGGAASVIGAFAAAAKARLPLNIVAVVPTCENMPDAGASKPGDIVTAMDGTTIEILNTDAEGRLILCDALTYAGQFRPAALIDAATLTGACIIALGHAASGLMSNNQQLADQLLAASRTSGDKIWQLPLFPEYKEQLKSNFADLQNIGGRAAGTITAAAFLSHFTESHPWAHLDIAGTAWKSGKEKGATGRPVALLLQFLRDRAA